MKNYLCLCLTLLFLSSCGEEKDIRIVEITIKDHKFVPAIVQLKENEKIRLIVKNLDSTVEEFESFDLKKEKIVPANSSINVPIGPLKKGEYSFFGEFHEATAQGKVVVEQ